MLYPPACRPYGLEAEQEARAGFSHSTPAIASRSGEAGGLVHFRHFRHFLLKISYEKPFYECMNTDYKED